MVDSDLQEPNIVAENVQVRYTVNTNDPGQSAKGLRRIGNALRGRQGQTTVRALRGVNFVAREGEMVGIVGANGSGKSTFLRNVAGVEQPDRGRILVRYQPLLLGVSAALQPALSGSENVRLGCLAMGLSPEEAAEAFDYVVDLSARAPPSIDLWAPTLRAWARDCGLRSRWPRGRRSCSSMKRSRRVMPPLPSEANARWMNSSQRLAPFCLSITLQR